MANQDNEYLTADTRLASYLSQEGFDILIVRYKQGKNNKQYATFAFDDSPKLREFISLYNRCEATVNLAIYETIKSKLIERIRRQLP